MARKRFLRHARNPPTLPSLGRGRAAPGTTAGVELCIRKSTKATPIASSNAATVSSHAEDSNSGFRKSPRLSRPRLRPAMAPSGQPGPGQQLCGFRKRRMAPRAWKASPRLSWPSLRPAMAPQWPARPRTAVIWLPKAPDGTLGLKTLAAPQPAQSSSSNGASVVRTAGIWLPKATDGTSGLKTLAAPQPAQSSSSNGASVASQAQDSNYMDSENDGWHLGLERPRRASAGPVMLSESDGWHLGLERPRRASAGPVFIQQWRQVASQDSSYVDSESRGWHPGLDKRRRASAGPASVASQAQDSSYMASESDGWHLGLENPRRASAGPAMLSESDGWHLGLERPRRASAGPVFVQQWRHSGQPGPGQQFYGFRKRRIAPLPRLSRTCLRPAMAPQWPARPRTAIICFPRATDGTSGLKGLAAPAPDSGDSR